MAILGLHVGVSFAELTLLHENGAEVLAFSRAYLPRSSLKSTLQKFIQKNIEHRITQVFFVCNHLEKLAPFRLGGSTAHLVTEGQENVGWLSQASRVPFRLQRFPAVQSQELIFGIKERMSAAGEILESLDLPAIASVAAKLKMMDVKKVCVHFLHSQKNPAHVTAARDLLREQGFEVYTADFDCDQDLEKSRRLSLNVALNGTWEEFRQDLKDALKTGGDEVPIQILSDGGFRGVDEVTDPVEALASLDHLWKRLPHKNIVYLGFETFTQIFPDQREIFWQSPWGNLFRPHSRKRNLSVQPTSPLHLNFFNELDFHETAESFEPGPVALGRGQKLTAFDLFFEELSEQEELKEWLAPAAASKISSGLVALGKGSKNNGGPQTVARQLKDLFLQKISLELDPDVEAPYLVGFWTRFLPAAKSDRAALRPLAEIVARLGMGLAP